MIFSADSLIFSADPFWPILIPSWTPLLLALSVSSARVLSSSLTLLRGSRDGAGAWPARWSLEPVVGVFPLFAVLGGFWTQGKEKIKPIDGLRYQVKINSFCSSHESSVTANLAEPALGSNLASQTVPQGNQYGPKTPGARKPTKIWITNKQSKQRICRQLYTNLRSNDSIMTRISNLHSELS